ncbi:uncharacterized protein LOC128645719 [Bombina bombina]|uniref:uncharacterized protein LOC128645719 n=1 Tax=Bombina bombina TaxID=8345 RepID=UPI00235AA8B3|nr:uncharacterized protein LOC128645719 [Bombina bombina]XP_053554902.1 uncharacterized protein LOC128645719 [Bombina bombina]
MFREKTQKCLLICIYLVMLHERARGHPSLTSKNFRSVLEWETEVESCDIELYNSSSSVWKPINVSPDCGRGICRADLTVHLMDIYIKYQAKVRCPSNQSSSWNTSNHIQLYKDMTVGPPILNLIVLNNKQDISVSLPFMPQTAPYGLLENFSTLDTLFVTATIDNNISYRNTHIVIKYPQTLSLFIPLPHGGQFCVNVTFPKREKTVGGRKCETLFPKTSAFPGVAILLLPLFLVCVLVVIIKRYWCPYQTPQPRVLELPFNSPHVLLEFEEQIPLDTLFLVTQDLDKEFSGAPSKGYECNGFLEKLHPYPDLEKEDEDFTGGSSEYSEDSNPHISEAPSIYKRISEDQNIHPNPNIDLNSIRLMGRESAEEGILLVQLMEGHNSQQGSSTDDISICCPEEDEGDEKWKSLTGYERRPSI